MESSDWEAECKSAHDPFSYVNTSTGAAAAAKAEKHVVWVPGALIVGGGPSGLAVAACLKARGVPSTVLERSGCVASLWQLRTYDRLRLHLPKRFCELPLMPFPSWFPTYPSKQQFVGYLEAYAEAFGVRPRFNETVVRAEYDGALGLWRVRSSTASKGEGRCTAAAGVEQEITEYLCRWLVVATGENAEPVVPEIEGMEGFEGAVLHTSLYRSGGAFRNKRVLVVGCGNSGMEVCLDLCNHGAHPSMVVRDSVHILPREILGFSTFGLSMLLLEWLPLLAVDRLLLLAARLTFGDTSKFSLCRPQLGPLHLKSLSGKTPVLDVGALANIKSGDIKVRPALKSLTKHGAEFVDGRSEEFDAVIFATGYKSNVPCWLKEKKFFSDRDGLPRKPFPNGWKGEKGLYAVGFTKRGLLGASLDAMSIAQDIEQSWKSNYGEKLTPLAHPSVI